MCSVKGLTFFRRMVEIPRPKVNVSGLTVPWLENQFVGSVQCSSLYSLLTFTNTYLRDGVPLATYDANSLWSSWLACWAQWQNSPKLVCFRFISVKILGRKIYARNQFSIVAVKKLKTKSDFLLKKM